MDTNSKQIASSPALSVSSPVSEQIKENKVETLIINHNISSSQVLFQLAYISDLTKQVGIALRMTHSSITFAQYLLQRFYYRISICDVCTIWTSGASILLSCKLHNIPQGQSIRNISNLLYDRINLRELPNDVVNGKTTVETTTPTNKKILDFYGAQGFEWKQGIIEVEKQILIQLGFNLLIQDVRIHHFIMIFVNALIEHSNKFPPFQMQLLQIAWNFANDCMLLNTCVVEKSEVIACSCIQLALTRLNVTNMPSGWQVVFGTSKTECDRVMKEIEKIYYLLDNGDSESNKLQLNGYFIDHSQTEAFQQFHPDVKAAQVERIEQFHKNIVENDSNSKNDDDETGQSNSVNPNRRRSPLDLNSIEIHKDSIKVNRKRRRFADASSK